MRKEKQLLLDEIKEKIDEFSSFIVMNYEKLSANNAHHFRSQLISAGGEWEVVRKKLLLKALKEADIAIDESTLEGHIALVLAKESVVESAKLVFQFSKDHADIFSVLGGYIEGKMYSGDEVKTLSNLPGKDQMRSELLGLLQAPLSQTLSTMEALLTSVCHCLQNKSDVEHS